MVAPFFVGLPYVYGGLAKLHGDWLAGEPKAPMVAPGRCDLPEVNLAESDFALSIRLENRSRRWAPPENALLPRLCLASQ